MLILILKFLAGIIFFLFGFYNIEEGVKLLSGRKFKLLLQKQTTSPFKSILAGTIVTALVQSSSIVSFLVLSFVSAGIIDLASALFIVLGSNLGTTLDSWVIAYLGFELNLEKLSLPMIILGGYFTMFSAAEKKWSNYGKLVLGLGFLFFGLEYIKLSVGSSVANLDYNFLESWHWTIFVLVGFAITAIIQSSSLTMAIVLSTLHANLFDLQTAMSIILGSELGTTLKLVIASYSGAVIKKQLAFGNLFFNLILILIHLPLIPFWQNVIVNKLSITNSLVALVIFQSLINLTTIILFVPFVRSITAGLIKIFKTQKENTISIHKVKPSEGEYAWEAISKEIDHYLQSVLLFFLRSFDSDFKFLIEKKIDDERFDIGISEFYDQLKHVNTDIRAYCIKLINLNKIPEQKDELINKLEMLSDALFTLKSMKDTWGDIHNFKNSANTIKYSVYLKNKERVERIVSKLHEIYFSIKENPEQKILIIEEEIKADHHASLAGFYDPILHHQLNEKEFATILNFERELQMAFTYLCVLFKKAL